MTNYYYCLLISQKRDLNCKSIRKDIRYQEFHRSAGYHTNFHRMDLQRAQDFCKFTSKYFYGNPAPGVCYPDGEYSAEDIRWI